MRLRTIVAVGALAGLVSWARSKAARPRAAVSGAPPATPVPRDGEPVASPADDLPDGWTVVDVDGRDGQAPG